MTWIGTATIMLFALALAAIPLILAGAAVVMLFGRARVLQLNGPSPTQVLSTLPPRLRDAIDLGYEHLGVYVYPSALGIQCVLSILVSPDRLVALLLVHAPSTDRREVFVSVRRDGGSIRTSNTPSLPDLAGMEHLEAFPIGPLRFRERFHRERLDEAADIVPWDSEAIPRSLELLDRARVARLVSLGHARWLDAAQTRFRFTPRAVVRILHSQIGTSMEHAVTRARQRIALYEREEREKQQLGDHLLNARI